MSLVEKIILGYFLLLGMFEIISNVYHLTRGTTERIAASAMRQHGELPKNLRANHYVTKAIIMAFFGMLFLALGLVMLLKGQFFAIPALAGMAVFGVYALIQALMYRTCPNVWGALIVYNLPLIGYVIWG